MTNWLWLFLAFYILVGQPALLGRMLDNCSLYQLAWLNAGIFVIAWIISAISKSWKKKTPAENSDNKVKVVNKSEEKVSRIENDEGIAIVEVEKKEEIVVETNKNEEEISGEQTESIEELPQNTEIEKKAENTSPERPMRENVSIPKIVQPIPWYQAPKKRKKNITWWQRIILLITLALAAVVAITLWEFLEKRCIAIALILWRILYLVIGKLFDVEGFYNAKKLFTNWLYIILILGWIGYGVNAMLSADKSLFPSDFGEKISTYVKDWFNSDKEDKSDNNTWDVIYVFEWTGEVITSTGEIDNLLDIENEDINVDGETIENSEPEIGTLEEVDVEPKNTIEDQITLSPEEAKKQVTMWEAIKSLLAGATLSTKTNKTFTYVSKSNELYPYFKTAQEKWMIGTDTDPSKIVSCETYITMKWIREWRNVGSYTKSEIKSVYWNKAVELWKLNWCKKWAYVTKGNL